MERRDRHATISPRDSVIYNKFFIHTGAMSMNPLDGHVKSVCWRNKS